MIVTRLQIGVARPRPGAYPMVSSSLAHAWQFHSFIGVNPLQTTWLEHGIVSGRVALLLRSAEIQPLFARFSDWASRFQSPPSLSIHPFILLLRGCPRVGAPATCKKYRRKKPPWSSSVAAIPLDSPIGPYGSNHSPDSVAAHRCPRVATEQLVLLSRRWSHPGAWAAASSQK